MASCAAYAALAGKLPVEQAAVAIAQMTEQLQQAPLADSACWNEKAGLQDDRRIGQVPEIGEIMTNDPNT